MCLGLGFDLRGFGLEFLWYRLFIAIVIGLVGGMIGGLVCGFVIVVGYRLVWLRAFVVAVCVGFGGLRVVWFVGLLLVGCVAYVLVVLLRLFVFAGFASRSGCLVFIVLVYVLFGLLLVLCFGCGFTGDLLVWVSCVVC